MNTDALITMLAVQIPVTLITIYFFWKVLKTPPKKEPDSFTDNDPK
jgi:heme/copper-type cytochrome/quinol oxidase subunit 2